MRVNYSSRDWAFVSPALSVALVSAILTTLSSAFATAIPTVLSVFWPCGTLNSDAKGHRLWFCATVVITSVKDMFAFLLGKPHPFGPDV